MESVKQADQAAAGLAGELVVPRGYDAAMAAALAVVIVMGAVNSRYQTGLTLVLFGISIAALFGAAAWAIRRFKEVNGVWVSGFRRGTTVPASIGAGLAYLLGLSAAMGAAAEGWWWLVGLIALAAAAGYVAASRWWMRLYRREKGSPR